MDKFDVIVVGAGPGGATAGYLLAKAGLNVLIIERGQTPGSKNVSGGLIYSKLVAEIYPQFWVDAPVERAITQHQVVMLGGNSSIALDFRSQAASQPPYNAFSVLRAQFDPWITKQAEEAGANLITGVTVDSLMMKNGRVVGILAGPDELQADLVVIAEGTRSLLLKQANLREDFQPHDVSLGVKEVIAIPETVIQERFQCAPGTGAAYTLVGQTSGVQGGGFLYTNKASLSLGLVLKIDSLNQKKLQPHQVMDDFKTHPLIASLIEGGEVVEYSAQTVHRGGFHLTSRLYGDGYVVVGSAARLLLNNIVTLRGMDFAVLSASLAARAILTARENGTLKAGGLSAYANLLKHSPLHQDWRTFKDTYPLLENERLFNVYPDLACRLIESLFNPSMQPNPKVLRTLRREMKGKLSVFTLLKDLLQIGRGMAL